MKRFTQAVLSSLFLFLHAGLVSATPPNIIDIFPTSGPTSGGTVLTINGQNFGTASGVATLNSLSMSILLWSDTRILATTPAGVGLNLPVQVSVGGLSSNIVFFSYDAPSISSINPTSGPTAGGTLLTIHGLSFGPSPGVARLSETNMTITAWSHTMVVATTPAGVGLDRPVQVLTASGTSNSAFFDYNEPSISGINPTSGPTSGGTTLTIIGQNYGESPGIATLDGVSMTITSWSHTTVRAVTPPGVGLGMPVRIVTTSGTSNSAAFSYSAPQILSINPTSGPTAGGIPLTINGQNFGPAPGSASLGGTSMEILDWSHTQIVAETPEGVGLNQSVQVTTASGTSSASGFNYNAPAILGISPTSGPTAGGIPLTINGQNFGPAPGSASLGGAAMDVISWSHSRVIAETPEGVGLNQEVRVTTDSGTSNVASFSYSDPSIFGINPTSGPTAGGIPLTINGQNFGPAPGSASLGGASMTILDWTHTQIVAETPEGVGLNQSVQVTTASGTSSVSGFNYSAPSILSISPTSGPTTGGIPLTINGQNFGPAPGSALLGSVSMSLQSWSHTRVIAQSPEGVGLNQEVRVSTASGVSNSASYNYDGPTIANLNPTSGPTAGGTVITIGGFNFGPAAGTATLGALSMVIDEWSHTSVKALTPASCGLDQPVRVMTASGASNALNYDHSPPYDRGDLNCNCDIGVDDVLAFVEALLQPGAFSGCDLVLADVNEDGVLDAADVQPFVNKLLGP